MLLSINFKSTTKAKEQTASNIWLNASRKNLCDRKVSVTLTWAWYTFYSFSLTIQLARMATLTKLSEGQSAPRFTWVKNKLQSATMLTSRTKFEKCAKRNSYFSLKRAMTMMKGHQKILKMMNKKLTFNQRRHLSSNLPYKGRMKLLKSKISNMKTAEKSEIDRCSSEDCL